MFNINIVDEVGASQFIYFERNNKRGIEILVNNIECTPDNDDCQFGGFNVKRMRFEEKPIFAPELEPLLDKLLNQYCYRYGLDFNKTLKKTRSVIEYTNNMYFINFYYEGHFEKIKKTRVETIIVDGILNLGSNIYFVIKLGRLAFVE